MKFLDNIKTGTKLIGGFLMVAALIVVVAVISFMNIKSINDGMTSLYIDRTIPIQTTGKAEASLLTLRGDSLKFILLPEQRDAIKQNIEEEKKSV
ncbi:MAG TPA: MCP four helix bundle domain-containing protein, partial [Leptolinea sp.]